MFLPFSVLTVAGDGLLGRTDSCLKSLCPFLRFLLLLRCSGIHCLRALNYMGIILLIFSLLKENRNCQGVVGEKNLVQISKGAINIINVLVHFSILNKLAR